MATPKPRFGRNDWIELGLKLLAEQGAEALTLERLTEAARKTRGSFYHHFQDVDAFLGALGSHWLAAEIEAKIAEIDRLAVAGKRREVLARHAASIEHALERELRRLAVHSPAIAHAVAQADERRIAFLVRLFQSEIGIGPAEALTRARLQHCFFVGAQMVFPDAEPRFLLGLQKAMGETVWRK